MTILSTRLRAARQAIFPKITQKDVALRLGLSASAVNLWEAGTTEPNATALRELSKWYGVSTDWLLGIDVQKPNKAINTNGPALHVAPVVDIENLNRWSWESPLEWCQTRIVHELGTAAAIIVSSEALATVCMPGDYAVISKAHEIEPGAIIVVSVGRTEEPVMRRYVREGKSEMLLTDDQRYPCYQLESGVRIIGRVVEVIRRTNLLK